MTPKSKKAMASVAALSLFLAACGTGGTDNDDDGLTPVTLGLMPLVDLAPVYLGKEQGFFEEEGVDIQFETGQGGAAIIPSVTSGDFDFGFSNPTSVIVAHAQGLPVRVIAPGGSSTGEIGEDYGAVVASGDSSLETAADLEGATVAVNTLQNIGDTSIRQSIRNDGGNPDAVEFIEMPLPDMLPALDSGQVDAIWMVEPFLTEALSEGAEPVAWNWIDVSPELMASLFFTSEQLANEEPELIDAFATAVSRSAEYAEEHPDEVREIVATYTDIPAETLAVITLPAWNSEIHVDSLQYLADLAYEDGLINSEVEVNDLIAE